MRIYRVGVWCWMLATPLFFAASVVVGLAWRHPSYSWAGNNISDLGNVSCGRWDTTRPRQVCSPWHVAMDSAFIATGVLLALGVLLTWSVLGRGAAARTAQLLIFAGATGYILAGAYPADVNENNHFLAALLIFFLGNAGMVAAAFAGAPALRAMRWLSLALGLTAMAGTALFLGQVDLGFGLGGMERVAVFPLLAWTVAAAVQLLREDRARTG